MFHIAAFYLFADLPDHETLRDRLVALGAEGDVKGTVLVASEGVNGTIAGPKEEVEAFLDLLRSDQRLAALEEKWSTAEEDPFLRLKVRLKKEIVTLRVGEVDSINNTGTHVPPADWNELISDPDTIVIDSRNDYEYVIGTFANAVNPETRRFGEFPAWIESQPDIKDKKLAMFCTGGIRCEKGTAFLKEQGFEEVYQLEGGILKYLEVVDPEESLWDGECYVFDRRVSVGHGLVPGDLEVCPNCNTVLDTDARARPEYRAGVNCPACHDTITEIRAARFAERQKQIELAAERGELHLGSSV
ncbi:MAG: rhodanese-related sulfurtransferase [Acidimicrobiia bacterium]